MLKDILDRLGRRNGVIDAARALLKSPQKKSVDEYKDAIARARNAESEAAAEIARIGAAYRNEAPSAALRYGLSRLNAAARQFCLAADGRIRNRSRDLFGWGRQAHGTPCPSGRSPGS